MHSVKTRIYFPFLPYPPHEGSARVVFESLLRLKPEERAQTELVIWKQSDEEIEHLKKQPYALSWETHLSDLRIVSLTCYAPKLAKKETSLHRLARVALSLTKPYASPELYYYSEEAFHAARTHARKTGQASLGIYHYAFSYPWLVQAERLEPKQVVVFHNLESELFQERANGGSDTGGIKKWIHLRNSKILAEHETALGQDPSRELWWISPRDQTTYERLSKPKAPLKFWPVQLTPTLKSSQPQKPPFRNLVFVGNLSFVSNRLGLVWILEKLCPELKHRGFGQTGETLEIIGRGADLDLIEKAKTYSFVKFLGYVESLENYYETAKPAVLIPDLGGSGIRIKLLEAISNHLPTLTTPLALERTPLQTGLGTESYLFVSDDPVAWGREISKGLKP